MKLVDIIDKVEGLNKPLVEGFFENQLTNYSDNQLSKLTKSKLIEVIEDFKSYAQEHLEDVESVHENIRNLVIELRLQKIKES